MNSDHSTHELEDALARLEAFPAPEGLLERCLETIPAAKAPSRFGGRKMLFARLAGTLAVVAAVAIVTTNPRLDWRNRPIAFSAALADTQRASASAPYHITTGRSRSFDALKKSMGEWESVQTYFDRERGSLSKGEISTLYLASGDEYIRTWGPHKVLGTNCVTLLHQGKERMKKTLGVGARSTFDAQLPESANTAIEEKKMMTGTWKGQPATLFIVTTKSTNPYIVAEQQWRIRTTYYADPKTERFLGKQTEVRFIDQNTDWQLLSESEFRYEKPDPALFDPKTLEQGASEKREQWLTPEADGYIDKVGKMVGVTAEWFTNHPGKDWQTFRYPKPAK
jgi:hypothetical protein